MAQNETNSGASEEKNKGVPETATVRPLRKLTRVKRPAEQTQPQEEKLPETGENGGAKPLRSLKPLRKQRPAAAAETPEPDGNINAEESTVSEENPPAPAVNGFGELGGAAFTIAPAGEELPEEAPAEEQVKVVSFGVPEHEEASVQEDGEAAPPEKTVQKKHSLKDILVKVCAIAASLVLVTALVFNMPIFRQKDSDSNVSLMYLIKHFQPLNKEGDLQENTMELNISSDVMERDFNDGLDLPQLIEGQYSVLLLGFDEEEFNTDVMWVLEFDIGHGKLNILQIPRDCCLPDYTTSPTGKINSVYAMGSNPNLTPIQKVVNAVQENFGIPIDAYVTTACFDIVGMVDLIGGIPIHIDNEIIYEADKIIPAGDIVLSGEQAEWFIRFRHEWLEGDIGRMQNQRRFMAAAMNKLLSIVSEEGRLKLYSYLKQIYDNEYVYTSLSLEDMSMVADFASTLSMDNVQVNMVPGEGALYYAPDGNTYDVYSVHKQATLDLLNKYYRPYQNDLIKWDSSIQELITDYEYYGYDDTSTTLDEVEEGDEPVRDPSKAPK